MCVLKVECVNWTDLKECDLELDWEGVGNEGTKTRGEEDKEGEEDRKGDVIFFEKKEKYDIKRIIELAKGWTLKMQIYKGRS